jgi:hypothetical protein
MAAPLSEDQITQLRTALSLIEAVDANPPDLGRNVELEPVLTRFRIRGNRSGFLRLSARSLRTVLGETFEGAPMPDCSAWVIFDDTRWASSDLLLSDQSLTSLATRYTISSQRRLRRKAALFHAVPWFVIGVLTTPALHLVTRGLAVALGAFGIDVHWSR